MRADEATGKAMDPYIGRGRVAACWVGRTAAGAPGALRGCAGRIAAGVEGARTG